MMTGMFTPFAIITMLVLLDADDDDDHCGLAGASETTGSLEQRGLPRSLCRLQDWYRPIGIVSEELF